MSTMRLISIGLALALSAGCGPAQPGAQEPAPQQEGAAGGAATTALESPREPAGEIGYAGPPTTGLEGPGADRDMDGIVDTADRCPDEPEDRDGFQDEDGCPDPDNDGDGILDMNDMCPNEAENLNGRQDEDGCPE
jgi:hypothetical protein